MNGSGWEEPQWPALLSLLGSSSDWECAADLQGVSVLFVSERVFLLANHRSSPTEHVTSGETSQHVPVDGCSHGGYVESWEAVEAESWA